MFKDRVKDTTTTTGTGPVTLSGSAPAGFIPFDDAFGHAGTTFYYCIEDGTNWEVGTGTLTDAVTLERTTVLASSNSGALENFPSGTKSVFCTIPADYLAGLGGVTNAGTENVIPKTDASGNLVDSGIRDDGSEITVERVLRGGNGAVLDISDDVTIRRGPSGNAGLLLSGGISVIGDSWAAGNSSTAKVDDDAQTFEVVAVNGMTVNGNPIAVQSDIPTVVSGVYTPTLTNQDNIDSSTPYECRYTQIGDVVTVNGRVGILCSNLGVVDAILKLTLPVSTALFTSVDDGSGLATRFKNGHTRSGDSVPVAGKIAAEYGDTLARLTFVTDGDYDVERDFYFTFSYKVIV